MHLDPWGNISGTGETSYNGLFAIRKSLDGEQQSEFVDKMQFIGIKIGHEDFLMSIENINEIIMLPNITYVPNSAKYIEPVVNLRGTILPVINVRKMMGMPKSAPTPSTRIIICKDDATNIKVGLLVDSITFVISLVPDDIDTTSPPASASGHEVLKGVSKHGSSVAGVLDLGKIISVAADGKTLEPSDDTESSDAAA